MSDVQEHMQRVLKEARAKNPGLAYRFIDAAPDELRRRTESDGWKIAKDKIGEGAREVRVGDLILACKPRKDVDEERKRTEQKTGRALDSATNQYYNRLSREGGGGRYIGPLTPTQAGTFGKKHTD